MTSDWHPCTLMQAQMLRIMARIPVKMSATYGMKWCNDIMEAITRGHLVIYNSRTGDVIIRVQ